MLREYPGRTNIGRSKQALLALGLVGIALVKVAAKVVGSIGAFSSHGGQAVLANCLQIFA